MKNKRIAIMTAGVAASLLGVIGISAYQRKIKKDLGFKEFQTDMDWFDEFYPVDVDILVPLFKYDGLNAITDIGSDVESIITGSEFGPLCRYYSMKNGINLKIASIFISELIPKYTEPIHSPGYKCDAAHAFRATNDILVKQWVTDCEDGKAVDVYWIIITHLLDGWCVTHLFAEHVKNKAVDSIKDDFAIILEEIKGAYESYTQKRRKPFLDFLTSESAEELTDNIARYKNSTNRYAISNIIVETKVGLSATLLLSYSYVKHDSDSFRTMRDCMNVESNSALNSNGFVVGTDVSDDDMLYAIVRCNTDEYCFVRLYFNYDSEMRDTAEQFISSLCLKLVDKLNAGK